MIDSFREEYEFLSNFYYHTMYINRIAYPTMEHYFQAHKSESRKIRIKIASANTPLRARRLGRKIQLAPDWDDNKRNKVMENGLNIKFYDKTLMNNLLETEDQILIEGNYWHDNYWGDCNCLDCMNIYGENWLGRLLMKIRKIKSSERLIRITAPHFAAGVVMDSSRMVFKTAPILKYMKSWSLDRIQKYCKRKEWRCEL